MRRDCRLAGWLSERGAIAPFAAIILVFVLGVAALATDVGAWYGQRRQLQAAADAAALSAVNAPDRAQAIASDIVARNGSGNATVSAVSTGVYCPNAELAPSARYKPMITACPNASFVPTAPNAVRVTATSSVPTGLSRALISDDVYRVSASATAARIDEAGLQAGSGLLRIDTTQSALLNLVLGNLLGTSLNLSAVQYDGLAHADLKALSFLNQLAIQLDLTAGTYDQLLQTQTKLTDLVQAAIDVLQTQGQVAQVAIDGLLTLQGKITGNPTIQLGDLVDLGVWRNQPIGSGDAAPSALDAGLNVLQLLTVALQAANGQNAVALPGVSLGLPGVASLQLTATVIEPPQSPPFAFGPVGMTVHTAQVRVQLKLQLLDLFGLLGQGIQLPLYVEVAAGEATLTGIDCGDEPDTDATVTVLARSGLARVYIGELPSGLMRNFDKAVSDNDVQTATLVGIGVGPLGLVRIDGKAVARLDGKSRSLTFTQTQIKNREVQSVNADPSAILSSLTSDLSATLDLRACVVSVFGTCLINLDLGNVLLRPTLAALHQLLDPVISNVLGPLLDNLLLALGIRIGNLDVVVTGVRCGVPVLVN